MILTLKPTELILRMTPTEELGYTEARLWTGVTDEGIAVQALIANVAVSNEDDQATFCRDLLVSPAPIPDTPAYPMRLIL